MVRKRSDPSCISELTSSETSRCQEDIDLIEPPRRMVSILLVSRQQTRLRPALCPPPSILRLHDIIPDVLFQTTNEFKSKLFKPHRRIFAAVRRHLNATRQTITQSKNWELQVQIQIWLNYREMISSERWLERLEKRNQRKRFQISGMS